MLKMSTYTTKIMQVNAMRSLNSHDIAYATAMKKGVDIVIVSEPNKRKVAGSNWVKDKRGYVAVIFLNKQTEVTSIRSEEGYLCFHLKQCKIYACYSSPNISMENFKADIDAIMQDSRKVGGESIILGDLNFKSPLWGSHKTDKRGEYWME